MNRLKELRQENNLTLKELSEQLSKRNIKISADALAKYERGDREPKIDKWNHLAEFYGVSPEYLMGLNNNSFGNRIKELRIKHGLSQTELADKTGVSEQAISFYENGKRHPKIETWQKIADYFNVSIPYVRGNIDTELIAKIAKMVFLIETTPFYTEYGQTLNVYDNSEMVCKLMLLLLKQVGLNCNDEVKAIVLKVQRILNDEKYDSMWGAPHLDKPVDYLTAKKYVEKMRESNGIDSFDINNITRDIEDAKALVTFYDKL